MADSSASTASAINLFAPSRSKSVRSSGVPCSGFGACIVVSLLTAYPPCWFVFVCSSSRIRHPSHPLHTPLSIISHKIDVSVNPDDLPLSDDDWALIYAIVNQYGPLSRQQVVKASKETLPMKDAGLYDILKFQRNPKIEWARRSFYENKHLVHETKKSVQDVSSDRISLEELRGEVVKST